jgi:carboxyl-terminal processing protease
VAATRRISTAAVAALLILFALPAGAQDIGEPSFDRGRAEAVYSAALNFMTPRILEPVPMPQLAVWGFGGLTALDPRLRAETSEKQLRLLNGPAPLVTMAPPPPDDVKAWGAVGAIMAATAWPDSEPLRRAGTTGVIRNYFDELFNHLDPYSRYEPPSEASEDRDQRSGASGIGVTLHQRGTAVVVGDVASDSPAGDAGIRSGDHLVSIDGELVHQAAAAAASLAGPDESTVTISWRSRDGKLRSAEMTRTLIVPETVFVQRVGPALMIRISSFNRSTSPSLAAILASDGGTARGRVPSSGVVIDLRGDRGGLLRQAVDAASLFLLPGAIASTIGRDPEATHHFRSEAGQMVAGTLPVVVIVDGRTASSAEIFAAALQDRGRAVVIGSATLGKGLVQTVAPMPDGGELFVTWSRVVTPLGWPLQGLGVLPQVCTSASEDQVMQSLQELDDGVTPMAQALTLHDAARAPVPPAQMVALRSACPAAVGRDLDLKVARWLIDHPVGYAAALLAPLRDEPSPTTPVAGAATAPAGTARP